MQKSKLDKFIQKYNLGGNVNSVKWKASGDSISTSFVTPDKSLLGSVKVDKFPFEDAEIGVYQTDQLKSLINVLGDDVSLDLTKFGDKAVSLKVINGPVSVDYVLSDLSVISDPPSMKRLPEFGTKIKLDSNFISTFIKGKGALSDVDTTGVTANSILKYNASTSKFEISSDATGGGGGGINNLVEDTTPQLGGVLDANGQNIDMGINFFLMRK